MTKKELMEMLKNVADNEQINFVAEAYDRDGYPYDRVENIYKVVGNYQVEIGEYDIKRVVPIN